MVGASLWLVNDAALCYDWRYRMKALLALALFSCPAWADEVELMSGAVIEGKVQDLGDSIKVIRGGSSVVYPKYMIRKITPKKTVEETFEDSAKALKDADLQGHLDLARWAVKQKLPKEAASEYRKVIALDPENEEARKGAGFVKLDGQWLTEDQANELKGLVKHKGRWMTPEEKNLEIALEEQKELDAQMTREITACLDRIRGGDEKKRQEAIDKLSKIDDKFKAKPLLASMTASSRPARKYCYEELGRMKEQTAAKPLCRRSLWDEDESLRPVAVKALVDIGHPDTALFLAPFLGEESVSARIRCAELMATFKDLRAAPVLVEALAACLLRIKHEDENQGEEQSALVNRSVILSDGSRITLPKVVKIKPDNRDKEHYSRLLTEKVTILSTLRVTTGQDLGEDVSKWRSWLQKRNP
jgi:hypothetical protein